MTLTATECFWNVFSFVVVTVVVDIGSRKFPLSLFALGVAISGWLAWFCGHTMSFHLLGGLAAFALGVIADVPGGDLKFLLVFGTMVGPTIAVWTLIPAFLVTLFAWSRGLTGVPWTVYIGVCYSLLTPMSVYLHTYL